MKYLQTSALLLVALMLTACGCARTENSSQTDASAATEPIEFVKVLTWPPKVTVTEDSFACEAGEEGEDIALTMLGGRLYCPRIETVEATGKRTYIYQTTKNDRLITLEFDVQLTDCAQLNPTLLEACEKAQFEFRTQNQIPDFVEQLEV